MKAYNRQSYILVQYFLFSTRKVVIVNELGKIEIRESAPFSKEAIHTRRY